MEKLNQSRFSKIIEIPQLCLRGMIRLYAYCISPLFPSSCRFHPTCSSYAYEALQIHGAIRGSVLILKRIGKCHPWGGYGIDRVPKQKRLKA